VGGEDQEKMTTGRGHAKKGKGRMAIEPELGKAMDDGMEWGGEEKQSLGQSLYGTARLS
jgi:hypothetical protein